MSEWQDISEAPEYGEFWVCGDNYGDPEKGQHVLIAVKRPFGFYEKHEGSGEQLLYLTHFMPFKEPEPPQKNPMKMNKTKEDKTALELLSAIEDRCSKLDIAEAHFIIEYVEMLRAKVEILSFESDPEALVIAHMHGAYSAKSDGQKKIERLETEVKRLESRIRYEEGLSTRIGTHSEGCWSWGHSHYPCAEREIKRLQDELAKR